MSEAIFLGRFQPFHEGHYKVVEKYMDDFEDLKIVIGSAGKKDEEENPLSFEERKEIIQECFPDLKVQALEDEEKTEEGNRKWASKLEKFNADTVISGNSLVQRLVEEYTDMDVLEPELHDPEIYSGTEIRRRIRSGEEWRYLVPKCAQDRIEELEERIREAGIDYEFEPGWKKENAYHGTANSDQ
ncbi:MAG: adenylyltransferase/cytidyltransferase family protein [Candidatus Nanosalina sp.]